MQKGYNSDVSFRGTAYHVQTEDLGDSFSYIVTKVFQGGAVIKSIKTQYSEIQNSGLKSKSESVVFAMRKQHQYILDQLNSGQLTK
jgi:hypothetical protein